MKYTWCMVFILALSVIYPAHAQVINNKMNCQLIEKKHALLESELAVVVEQYKIYFRQKVLPEMKAKNGKIAQIKINRNNKLVKAMNNLTIAAATYEALKDACYDSSLKPVSKEKGDYQATLIPESSKQQQ